MASKGFHTVMCFHNKTCFDLWNLSNVPLYIKPYTYVKTFLNAIKAIIAQFRIVKIVTKRVNNFMTFMFFRVHTELIWNKSFEKSYFQKTPKNFLNFPNSLQPQKLHRLHWSFARILRRWTFGQSCDSKLTLIVYMHLGQLSIAAISIWQSVYAMQPRICTSPALESKHSWNIEHENSRLVSYIDSKRVLDSLYK